MEAIVATYRDGVLTPQRPLELPEGSQVTVWVDPRAYQRDKLTEEDRAFFERLAHERAPVFRRLAE